MVSELAFPQIYNSHRMFLQIWIGHPDQTVQKFDDTPPLFLW